MKVDLAWPWEVSRMLRRHFDRAFQLSAVKLFDSSEESFCARQTSRSARMFAGDAIPTGHDSPRQELVLTVLML